MPVRACAREFRGVLILQLSLSSIQIYDQSDLKNMAACASFWRRFDV